MTDDPVLALRGEQRALAAERSVLAGEHARRAATDDRQAVVDDAFADFAERWHPAMRRLADTPAASLDGVLLKLRVLAGSMLAGRESVYDEDLLLLAIADLERLARERAPAATETAIPSDR